MRFHRASSRHVGWLVQLDRRIGQQAGAVRTGGRSTKVDIVPRHSTQAQYSTQTQYAGTTYTHSTQAHHTGTAHRHNTQAQYGGTECRQSTQLRCTRTAKVRHRRHRTKVQDAGTERRLPMPAYHSYLMHPPCRLYVHTAPLPVPLRTVPALVPAVCACYCMRLPVQCPCVLCLPL